MAASSFCVSSWGGHEEHILPHVVSLGSYITSQFHRAAAGRVQPHPWPAPSPRNTQGPAENSLISTGYHPLSRWPIPKLGSSAHHMFFLTLKLSHSRRSLLGQVAQDQTEYLRKIVANLG